MLYLRTSGKLLRASRQSKFEMRCADTLHELRLHRISLPTFKIHWKGVRSVFLLLLVVGLHLVGRFLRARLDVGGVVTDIVDKLRLVSEVHDVRVDGVYEILRMRCDDEDVVVGGEVRFEPNDDAEIQVIGRFAKQEMYLRLRAHLLPGTIL